MKGTSNAVPWVLIAESDPWSRDLLMQLLLSVRCDARVQGLQDLIASVYALMGVYGKPALVMNLAGQWVNLPAEDDIRPVANSKAGRLLGVEAAALVALRKGAGLAAPEAGA
jgi:hypothetical protein